MDPSRFNFIPITSVFPTCHHRPSCLIKKDIKIKLDLRYYLAIRSIITNMPGCNSYCPDFNEYNKQINQYIRLSQYNKQQFKLTNI